MQLNTQQTTLNKISLDNSKKIYGYFYVNNDEVRTILDKLNNYDIFFEVDKTDLTLFGSEIQNIVFINLFKLIKIS